MRPAMGVAVVGALAVAGGAFALVSSNGSSTAGATAAPPPHPHGVRVGCSRRSEANFPGAYSSPRNLVVGPLVLIGGAYTDPATVRRFHGNKFPALVEAGHIVTVRVAQPGRRTAGLAYGPLPQGRQTQLRDTHRTVTFVACRPGKPPRHYSPNGPSASHASGRAVTFWSGAVVTQGPACVPLDVYLDDARSPRRVGLALGRRCSQ